MGAALNMDVWPMKFPVKLRRDAEGQFVCIPSQFELPNEDVIIRKVSDKLIIEPAPQKKQLLELLR